METHRLHFIITILTIFMVVSFCISRMSTVSAMEVAASAATTNSSVVNSEKVHQEPPFNYNLMILKNLDGFQDLPTLSSDSDDSASFINNNNNSHQLKSIMMGVIFGGIVFLLFLVLWRLRISNRNGGIANQRERAGDSPLLPPPPAAGGGGSGGGESSSMSSGELSNLGEVLTLEQIRRATGNFNVSNLIKQGHSGDLFQGHLGETRVVIKRIDVGSSTQKKESYKVELNFFKSRALDQTGLVSLFGHCLDQENEKFLVYQYMSKGDFSNIFYYTRLRDGRPSFCRNGNLQRLGWQKRTKIAREVAEALCYLHNQCRPPLVHRDVQESSILLGDNYDVRLGSLSKVNTVITGGSPASATCAYDVYCFGKILLKLVAGDVSRDTTEKEWLEQTLKSINTAGGSKSVRKIMDEFLIASANQLEEVWAMAIVAKSCLHRIPSKRPHMTDILHALMNLSQVTKADNWFNRPQQAPRQL